MIKRVKLHRFKRFKDESIDLNSVGLSVVAGPNNAGKSSLLHSLAVWSFCRGVVEFERGREALSHGSTKSGVGIGDDEFFPINVPTLAHLWSNLKTQRVSANLDEPDGYTLKIKCFWDIENQEKFLEFGLALANDRLFIKTTDSNLGGGDHIPRVAFLPPFAGITDKEARLSKAESAALIGQGLAGATIRNTLLDLYVANLERRTELKAGKSKLSARLLRELRETDPWERLSSSLEDTFSYGLKVHDFNPTYHRFVRVEGFKGEVRARRFQKHTGFIPRDLMVEGSGFLQWLSVCALAVSPSVDVLLLDEPDAHLHLQLQTQLLDELERIAPSKQILMATHSAELLRRHPHEKILWVKGTSAKYLSDPDQRTGLLAGVGSEYFPRLDALSRNKRLLIVEGPFDEKCLRSLCKKACKVWPENVVVWHWNGGHKERKQLFLQLKSEISDIKGISLRDRDDETLVSTGEDLLDSGHNKIDGLTCLKWPRRHLDSYIIVPRAIAKASGKTEEEIVTWLQTEHSVHIPKNHSDHTVPVAVKDIRGKELLREATASVCKEFCITIDSIIEAMDATDVAEDVIRFFDHLTQLSE
jgi:predicted ATPase